MIDSLWKAFSNQNGFENIVYIMSLCFNGIAFITIKCWMLQIFWSVYVFLANFIINKPSNGTKDTDLRQDESDFKLADTTIHFISINHCFAFRHLKKFMDMKQPDTCDTTSNIPNSK